MITNDKTIQDAVSAQAFLWKLDNGKTLPMLGLFYLTGNCWMPLLALMLIFSALLYAY